MSEKIPHLDEVPVRDDSFLDLHSLCDDFPMSHDGGLPDGGGMIPPDILCNPWGGRVGENHARYNCIVLSIIPFQWGVIFLASLPVPARMGRRAWRGAISPLRWWSLGRREISTIMLAEIDDAEY